MQIKQPKGKIQRMQVADIKTPSVGRSLSEIFSLLDNSTDLKQISTQNKKRLFTDEKGTFMEQDGTLDEGKQIAE
ncbi:MAG TPA: hypothetical protein VK338_03445 [Candidatus Nitrosocosmicus sp.]|nr:hypothetical protein [Candidatus Nitrosocosmicus sp.]